MYELAIKALMDNDPELAIHEIRTVMTQLRETADGFVLTEAIADDVQATTDFLRFYGWEFS